jgi:hypothetical protein
MFVVCRLIQDRTTGGGGGVKALPLSLYCKMPATLVIVHLFHEKTMGTVKRYVQFCTAST